ncbi:MAG: hypothetical protein CL674_16590 [Bdellovibrionaceae bacterium]|nr:hypothetical protein [Pseudobdellovibrionaceae bacterium]
MKIVHLIFDSDDMTLNLIISKLDIKMVIIKLKGLDFTLNKYSKTPINVLIKKKSPRNAIK